MNPVEIEEAVTALTEAPFDAAEFPYSLLEAFGNKATTIKRLRTGNTNRSDVEGAVLQTNNIHIATADTGQTSETLSLLRNSPATQRAKAKFILATDGDRLEAEDLSTGNLLECAFTELPDHFGFLLPLAGITTVKEIRDKSIDIRATSRLNRLYVELLRHNPEWGEGENRVSMNKFMARLIFCFFAEDTGILSEPELFTQTLDMMSTANASNTDDVIKTLFTSMATKPSERTGIPGWADKFPYVNGGLFSGNITVPTFTRSARSYLLHVGRLNWQEINPDIFGSMIQAVADEDERSELGMHYTSVPNILKVLNPLFLDDLRSQLEKAGDNPRKLLNLRNRMSRIRVFDPAAGSGNFLVIAYKEMRAIEAEINKRRGEPDRATELPLTNYRGIEIKSFAAEIARLALIIAEYQSDVFYRGHFLALNEFLPLQANNWITQGNALRLDWLALCPPTGTTARHTSIGLFPPEEAQAEIDFENEGGETFIVGNPPYLGRALQSPSQKADLEAVCNGRIPQWKSLDYIAGWFIKAADYGVHTKSATAFVTTNSISQGQQVGILWPTIFENGHRIHFAHTSFKWANLASHNAGVTVAIIGITRTPPLVRKLYSINHTGKTIVTDTDHINAYLVAGADTLVKPLNSPISDLPTMSYGNMANDGGHLLLSASELAALNLTKSQNDRFVRPIYGSAEFIRGLRRYCLWIEDKHLDQAKSIPSISVRLEKVADVRSHSTRPATAELASAPHKFGFTSHYGTEDIIIIPRHSSEARDYLPVGYLPPGSIASDAAIALFDAPLWNMALIASRLHLVWIAAVCGKIKTDFRYSNTLGWNTFPVPTLTEKNKADLTAAAEEILLAREAHFPATIADLYKPDEMPENLRRAHERNDEIIERIFIGRRFKNDTERLEKLFDLYQKSQAQPARRKVTG